MDQFDINVEGMSCGGCVASVDKALRDLPGVTVVKVDLAAGRAHVEGDGLRREVLVQRVEALGYAAS